MQQYTSKYLPAIPLLRPLGGVKRSNSTFFQNMVMLHIKLKGMTYTQHGSRDLDKHEGLCAQFYRLVFRMTRFVSLCGYLIKSNLNCFALLSKL